MSLRLEYPYTRKCPESWVTVDSADSKGEYNPLISCGNSGPCSPMEESDAARTAAAEANAENIREARAHEPVAPMPPPTSKLNVAAVPRGASPNVVGADSGAINETDFPTDKLMPWRKMRVLNDPNTQLVVQGANGKIYKIPGGVRAYFLNNEKGGPAVNVCRGIEKGDDVFIRCDRKGGFRNGPHPQPWWWRYEAVIEGSTVRIVSVSQKDGPLERGERVSDHFHDDIEETDGR
ncbi:MAG: hypothetical protein ABSF34_22500 [Verrucomicrobiota bacterium]